MTLHWPQIVWLILQGAGLVYVASTTHGNRDVLWSRLISIAVISVLLYCGGFFGP